MRYSNQGRFRQQVSFLRRQFLQDGEFAVQHCAVRVGSWRTHWQRSMFIGWIGSILRWSRCGSFLGQVLSADHSCRAAVARLIAHRVSRGQSPCSAETGAYCQARKRLPEAFFSDVARWTGSALESKVNSNWLWKRRRVYIYDGSSVSMPDTPANQRDYPQPDTQKPGLGFPLARIAAVFSLVLWRGAGTGDLPLRRQGPK